LLGGGDADTQRDHRNGEHGTYHLLASPFAGTQHVALSADRLAFHCQFQPAENMGK
jgi:hypothetical protein